MKCLNCGCASESYLCTDCRTEEVLDRIFNEIRSFSSEPCENPYLLELMSGCTERYAERDIIPDILNLFSTEVNEFYFCQYYFMLKTFGYGDTFENAAVKYLKGHEVSEEHTQIVLYNLIKYYKDFTKPKKWCDLVAKTDDLCCDLYYIAAEYFARIAEYDLAESITDKATALCDDVTRRKFVYSSPEKMPEKLEKQKKQINDYRTKPYWPKTEERRCELAKIYDEKGIKYPRISQKPKKVKEEDFEPLVEFSGDSLTDYCVFWCSETTPITGPKNKKDIYQIAAAKVKEGKIIDTFESLVHPPKVNEIKIAAKEIDIDEEMLLEAEDVDLVMLKFFAFVGDDVLVSTGALGNQAKLISRAARYTGMNAIKNEFYDILDFAADISEKFDGKNNTREYLLSRFSVKEGKTALEKAKINKQLYDLLKGLGE